MASQDENDHHPVFMKNIPTQIVFEAVKIIGADGISEAEMETRIGALVSDAMSRRRLRDCIPEAFGLILASHICEKLNFPKAFLAQNQSGEWQSIPFHQEPVFIEAIKIAQHIFHHGPRSWFKNISELSATTSTINNTLNAGGSLDDALLTGPKMPGIPAEIYREVPSNQTH